jgi:ribosomal protein S12 methylthiotransferase accessory factor YcaO
MCANFAMCATCGAHPSMQILYTQAILEWLAQQWVIQMSLHPETHSCTEDLRYAPYLSAATS